MTSTSLFASRKKPKRVGREPVEGLEEGNAEGMSTFPSVPDSSDASQCRDFDTDIVQTDEGPVVRKPTSSTPRTKSKLRLSFDPSEARTADSHGNFSTVPRKPAGASDRMRSLNRQSDIASMTFDRPNYSKDYLSELRNSTPTTPKDLSTHTSSAEDEPVLDIASKFRSQSTVSHIPSAAQIEEKKQRRARFAEEQGSENFIALEDYDSDGEFKPQRMQVSKFLDDSLQKDTRLVHDDEDMAEGFEAFVDDPGKVTLSRKAKRQQEREEKETMRSMIADAEDSSDESDSSAERNYAYETAQTSHGMDGLSLKQKQSRKLQQPKEITAVPKLSVILAKFREGIQETERRSEKPCPLDTRRPS